MIYEIGNIKKIVTWQYIDEYPLPLVAFSQHDYINTQPSHDHIITKLYHNSMLKYRFC